MDIAIERVSSPTAEVRQLVAELDDALAGPYRPEQHHGFTVEQLFEVHVERVNIVKVQAKPKRRGLFKGTRPGWKKAVVQVREGETIEIFEGAQV